MTVTTQQLLRPATRVARLDLDGVAGGRRPRWSAPADGSVDRAAPAPAAARRLGRAARRSPRGRSRSPRRTPRRGSSSAARSAPSRPSRSGWRTATSTRSAQRLALWQAAWRLDEGLPADTEIAIAKLWAADAGHRIAHTTVHVHGGVGIDLDGEAHRYFTSAKRYEFAARRRHRAGAAHRPDARDRAGLTRRGPRPSSSCCVSAPRTTTSGCCSRASATGWGEEFVQHGAERAALGGARPAPARPVPHFGVLLDNQPEYLF